MDAGVNHFLDNFSPSGRGQLLSHVIHQDLADGDYLFREGDPADGVCLVLEGQVDIVKTAGDREQIFTCFQPGDFLGEVAVLDGHGRSTDARAHGPTRIARIPKKQLLEVLQTEPVGVTMHLFQNVLTHLRNTNDLFVQEVVRKEKLSLVGEMASSLMHDLRNPLQCIHLASELITMTHSDEDTLKCCHKIRLQCDRVVSMASELLEFSRGQAKLELARTDTGTFLQRFIDLNEDYFRQTGLKFNVEAEPAEIEIDSMRLLRVLQNLISNAVEAIGTKAGGRVDIRAWVADGIFNLAVADNGPGIPDAVKDRLFEPFFTYGKKSGTGLGMAIVKSIVEAHRGNITFETIAGKGTQFLVQMPQDTGSPSLP